MTRSLIRRAAFGLFVLSALSSFLGYVRDAGIATVFGASINTDAFFVGSFLPVMLYTVVVTGSLVPALLPVFTQLAEQGALEDGTRLVAAVGRRLMLLLVVIVIGGELAAIPLIRVMAPGFDSGTTVRAALYLRLSLPMLFFLGPSALAGAVLNFRRNFIAPALGAVAFSGIVVASVPLSRHFGLQTVALAMVVGGALQLLVQIPALTPTLRRAVLLLLSGEDMARVRRVSHLAAPLLLFMILAQSPPLLDRLLSSYESVEPVDAVCGEHLSRVPRTQRGRYRLAPLDPAG